MRKEIVIGIMGILLIGIVVLLINRNSSTLTGKAISEFIPSTEAQAVSGTRVPLATEKSTFTFTGKAIGKSHVGTFNEWSGDFIVKDGKIVGLIGEINAESVNTGISKLDSHLRSEDFFDTEHYKKITFISTNIREVNGQMIVTGNLEFIGKVKEISFPATLTTNQLTATVDVDTSMFGMKYLGVDKMVRISLDSKA